MKDLTQGLALIIQEKVAFDVFAIIRGTVEASVYDNGSNEFPTHVKVETNVGGGGMNLTLSGNQVIKKEVSGISVTVTISKWQLTEQELSFHVKGVAQKSFFKKTIIDRSLRGNRRNKVVFEELLASTHEQLEAAAKSEQG